MALRKYRSTRQLATPPETYLGRHHHWTRHQIFRDIISRLEHKERFSGFPNLHAEWSDMWRGKIVR